MYLIHRLKTSEHRIRLDAEKALRPEAFVTVHEKWRGEVTHVGFEWELESAEQDGKYAGHSFVFMIPVEAIDRAYEVLGKLKERFKTNELPTEGTDRA